MEQESGDKVDSDSELGTESSDSEPEQTQQQDQAEVQDDPGPGAKIPGQVIPDTPTPGQVIPDTQTPGQIIPGKQTPGSVIPGKQTLGPVIPGKQTPGQSEPGKIGPEKGMHDGSQGDNSSAADGGRALGTTHHTRGRHYADYKDYQQQQAAIALQRLQHASARDDVNSLGQVVVKKSDSDSEHAVIEAGKTLAQGEDQAKVRVGHDTGTPRAHVIRNLANVGGSAVDVRGSMHMLVSPRSSAHTGAESGLMASLTSAAAKDNPGGLSAHSGPHSFDGLTSPRDVAKIPEGQYDVLNKYVVCADVCVCVCLCV
jgi:hypothetical protein